MSTLTIRLDPTGSCPDDQELAGFVEALEAAGFSVTVEIARPRRSSYLHPAYDLAVYVFENADNVVAAALIARYATATLGRRAGRDPVPVTGAIFDQDGAIIREIVLERTPGP